MRIVSKISLGSLLVAIVILFSSCKREAPYRTYEGMVFHTYFRILYQSDENQEALIDRTLQAVNQSANPFDSTSLLYAINNNHTTRADSTLTYLWHKAQEVWQWSHGTYDVTISPLVNAWGFGFEPAIPITPHKIDSLRLLVGMQKVELVGGDFIKQHNEIQLDFASIAKGYAADKVAEALRQVGVTNYLVEIGGEIAYKGLNPQKELWRIGINSPKIDSTYQTQEIEDVILLTRNQAGIATSGNYRNYKKDPQTGLLFGHTISPLTGYPAKSDILSATILAPDCATADALATAFMTMTFREIERMAPLLDKDIDYLLIVADPTNKASGYRTIATPNLRSALNSQSAPR